MADIIKVNDILTSGTTHTQEISMISNDEISESILFKLLIEKLDEVIDKVNTEHP